MGELEINKKIRANAVSSYLLLFISGAFLFNKKDRLLNNSFVKSHVKTALFIHLGFLLSYIIFLKVGLGISFSIFSYSISQIASIFSFILLFIALLFGIYKANLGEQFSIIKTIKLEKKDLLNISSQNKFNEKDKLTIIISRIPLIGFLISPRFIGNKIIENTTKLNLLFSVVIFALYIFGNPNLSTLLLLSYIVLVVFLSINLLVSNEVMSFNLNKVPNIKAIRIGSLTLIKYLKNYFSKNKFIGYSEIYNNIEKAKKLQLETDEKELKLKTNFKLPDLLVYIPILNLLALFNLNSKLKKHIINGVIISVLFIISWLLFNFSNKYQLLLLFPIFFGIGHLKTRLSYELPFLYDIYYVARAIILKLKTSFSFVKKKHKEEKVLNLKVED